MGKKTTPRAQKRTDQEADPRFAAVVETFSRDPHVGRRRLFGSSNVLNVNGKIFAMLWKDRFVAKLPKETVAELVRTGKGEYWDPGHGRRMKEWVAVGGTKASWVNLGKEAYRFVKGQRS